METSNVEQTANEFVNVSDIRDIFLYTKDGYIFGYLRVYPFNLALLSKEECRVLTNRLSAAFDGDRKDFLYCSLPRELDLDNYKNHLKQRRMECLEELGRKNIIDCLIQKANEESNSRENFEHQQFYKIWRRIGKSRLTAEAELRDRILLIKGIYTDAQIECEIMQERDIIKLCNLFSNRRSASYDVMSSKLQPEIPFIRE